MRSKPPRFWMPVFLTWICCAAQLSAQHYQPFGPINHTPSLQPFAPVSDVDLTEGLPPNEGYFFTYERLNWAVSKPDRSLIGATVGPQTNTHVTNQAWVPNPDQATILALQSNFSYDVAQINSVNDAVADTEFGWGNRYNIGYIVDDEGWFTSIIGGMRQNYQREYGFDDQRLNVLPAVQGLPGRDGIVDDQIPAPPMGMPMDTAPVAATAGNVIIPAVDGYTGVSVIFLDPLNLLQGFLDINADRVPEDINQNGTFGNAIDTDADGVPDTPALTTDIGDLTPLATIFDDMVVRNRLSINSVELMKIKRLAPTHRGALIELFYGVRYMELNDRFSVQARGGVLADSDWQNQVYNRMIGPQFGFRHSHKRRRWNFVIEGRFTAAANFISYNQEANIGTLMVSGIGNFPNGLAPTQLLRTHNSEEFSPIGELKVSTDFQLSRAVSLTVGWTGLATSNVTRAANTIHYELPALGIVEKTEDMFANGVNFGVVINR